MDRRSESSDNPVPEPFGAGEGLKKLAQEFSALKRLPSLTACSILILKGLVPSFMRASLSQEHSASPLNLAALNGLRGGACLFVAIGHYTSILSQAPSHGYGVDDNNKYLVQLPFVTLVFQGAVMVSIFFVISGAALSIKSLHHMRQDQHAVVLATLSSTLLRRFIRLYLPVFAVTLGLAIATWAGLFEPGRVARAAFPAAIQGPADAPPRLSLVNQLWTWFAGCEQMVRSGSPHEWHGHTWTIPIEFNNSLAVFLILLSIARLRYKGRLLILGSLLLLCYRWVWPSLLNFCAGALIADVYLQFRGPLSKRNLVLPRHAIARIAKRWKGQAYAVFLMIGLYFCSVPDSSMDTPFFRWMNFCTPAAWSPSSSFWRCTGAIIVVAVVIFWDNLNLFVQPTAQYFGKISFALYLVHGPVLRSLTFAALPHIFKLTGGVETDISIFWTWLLGALVSFPVAIWVADIFWRCCDLPSRKIACWMEETLIKPAVNRDGRRNSG